MIPLTLGCLAEADQPFVTRLSTDTTVQHGERISVLHMEVDRSTVWTGAAGLFVIDGLAGAELDGDVVAVDPATGHAERLFRAKSTQNTLLVTERCDQLCVMCSQPPKKTHRDRFEVYEQACLLAPSDAVVGITGGEPTLYKVELFSLIERTLESRPDLQFHVLTNGQHFDPDDVDRLRGPAFQRVQWGIPLYAPDAETHDKIVGKPGAFARLEQSLVELAMAGAQIELRTVVISDNLDCLGELAEHIASRLRFVGVWSIMQLENIGFARNRWQSLYVDHSINFDPIAKALDTAQLHGIPARLFNFPRCTVPANYRRSASVSISDWKRKFAPSCVTCSEQKLCTGFFEWHPDDAMLGVQSL